MRLRHMMMSLALTVSTAALAHTHLEGSVPADKSRVKAPSAIELHFSEAAKLTALSVQKGKEAAVAVKPLPSAMAADVSVPVPALADGDYTVNWRAASDDGHVVSGKFAFTVDATAPAAAAVAGHAAAHADEHARQH